MKIDLYEFLIDKGYGEHSAAEVCEAYEKGGMKKVVKEVSAWGDPEQHDYRDEVRNDVLEWKKK